MDNAHTKGRHVVLVNCPDMAWEPTTRELQQQRRGACWGAHATVRCRLHMSLTALGPFCSGSSAAVRAELPPSILSCLKGTVMLPGVTAAAPTPAELPHLFGAAAAAAAAGVGSAGAGGAAAGDAAAGAAAAGDAGGKGAPASGGRAGRPASVFPDALLPALVSLVHNSSTPLDALVKQFVEAQAAAGVKVAKARVRDKIKEVSSMRMVAKAPLYTVRPEVLAAVEHGLPLPPLAPAVTAAAGGGDEPTHMQVDAPAAGDAGEAGAGVGSKRPAGAAAAPEQRQQPDQQQQGTGQPGSSCPPSKKHRATPAGGGIERFFSAAKAAPRPQQRGQQQQHTPPSTPKAQVSGGAPLDQAAQRGTAAGAGSKAGGAAAAGADGGCNSVLPMLTPPSDAAAAEERPGKGRHSPVPFRLNSMAAQEAGAEADGVAQQQPDPRQRTLHHVLGGRRPEQRGLPGGSAASPAAAAAPVAAKTVSPPQLLAAGSPPSMAFWRQLAVWIVAVREPSYEDIEAAFRVFDEDSLHACLHAMPQVGGVG